MRKEEYDRQRKEKWSNALGVILSSCLSVKFFIDLKLTFELFQALGITIILFIGFACFFGWFIGLIWKCLAVVGREFFSSNAESERKIRKYIKKENNEICDVEIKGGKAVITRYRYPKK